MGRDLFGPIKPIMDDYERDYLNIDERTESEDNMEQSAITEGLTDVLDRLDDLHQAADVLEQVTGIRLLNVPDNILVIGWDQLNLLATEFDQQITINPIIAPLYHYKAEYSITINCIKVFCYA
jgi:hypothetical protein